MPTEYTPRDLEMESRLVRIEEKVDELGRRIDEALLTQLKDHGKRLALLEKRQIWVAGWIAGAACAASGVTALLMRMLG